MKNISIYRPTSIEEAIEILSRHGTEAGVYAGGTDLLIRLKNRLKQAPTYLVDIKKIDNLRYIKEDAQGGVQIGAATKIAEVANSDLLKKKYPMLVQAANMISSPELRNASTIGGDLLQEVWCQYLRGGYSCWRNGGYICYGAIGDNSYYHSAMGGRLCYAVYPGDAATALIPYDAQRKAGHSCWREGTVHRAARARGHDGRWPNPVACGSLQRNPHRSGHSAAQARRARLVRKAAAARRLGFRHGVAGHDSCSFRIRPSSMRVSSSAGFQASRCEKQRWKISSRERR